MFIISRHSLSLKVFQSQIEVAKLKETIRRKLQEEGIEHITIEFETATENCCFENCCE